MKPRKRADLMLACPVLLAAIAILIIAGCTDAVPDQQDQAPALSETPHENPAAAGKNNPTTRAPAQPAPVRSTSVPDTSLPYITFDPVGDKNIGDLLVFSGTTNLPEKTAVYLYRTFGSTGEEKLVSNREVFAGPDGTNRWRFVSDSSGFDPGSYSMTVTNGKKDVKGSAQFTLSGTSLRPKSVVYYSGAKKSSPGTPTITVNSIAEHKQGDVFLITGTSSLEEGTLLLCDIHPVYFDDASKRPATVYKGPSGTAGDTLVVRGTGGLNTWSFALDTNAFEKTEYVVNVTTVSEDFTIREIVGKAQFALK